MTASAPRLSVVVVSWNTRDVLASCLDSVRRHLDGIAHEMIVVDNASADGSAEMVAAAFPDVRLVRNSENLGFGRAYNLGMQRRARRLAPPPQQRRLPRRRSLVALLERLDARPEIGVAGPRLVDADGRLQPSAHRFGSLRRLIVEELGLYKLLSRQRAAASSSAATGSTTRSAPSTG